MICVRVLMLGGMAVAATGLISCTASPSPTTGPPLSPSPSSSMTPAQSALPDDAPLPSRSGEALAVVEARDGEVTGVTGQADPGVSYVVHAACRGASALTYQVSVDGEPVTASTFTCGLDTVSSAFAGRSGLVQIEFVDAGDGIEALAEVVPES